MLLTVYRDLFKFWVRIVFRIRPLNVCASPAFGRGRYVRMARTHPLIIYVRNTLAKINNKNIIQ